MRYLIFLLLLSGCAASRSEFKADSSDILINVMANDAASKIKFMYPDGKAKLFVIDSNKYGSALSAALRKAGFAISETESEAKSLKYFVDKLDAKLCRVSLEIDKFKLSRAYLDGTQPSYASDWTIGVENGR